LVEFGVLGPLQVNGSDVVLPAKARAVLAALLLNANRVVPVSTLIDALWDDEPPPSARTTLQGYIKHLRRNVDLQARERLVTRPSGYLITVAPGELDLDRFISECEHARAAAARYDWPEAARTFEKALALWRGAPLADVPSALLERTEVPRLAELRTRAIESRVDADLRLGRHAELVAELRLLTSGEPLREGMHGQLMLALYRCGRQAEALEVFLGIDGRLREELGICAGPELQELHRRVLAADPALSGRQAVDQVASPGSTSHPSAAASPVAIEQPVVPAQLPADAVDFAGRGEQVKLLCDLLGAPRDDERPGAVIITTVAGMGGIGKSALAVHVAHRLRDRFPDGQLYVSLQGASCPLSPTEVLSRLMRDLGDRDTTLPAGEAERAARYRTLLADRRVLIVLDDARDAAQVRPLLPGSASCAVIVTSRNVISELPGSVLLGLDVLSPVEALAMFSAIIGAPRAAAEQEATTRVLESCAGLPLAIRIAGSRLASRPAWSIAHLAAKLDDERGRLGQLAVGDLAVRANFGVSYEALPVGESRTGPPASADPARVFRLLGLASQLSPLSLPAITAMAAEPAVKVAVALDTLTNASLAESPAPDRYRLHDLLRSYAAELAVSADSQPDRNAAIGRLLTWYAERAYVCALALQSARRPPLIIAVPEAVLAEQPDAAQAYCWYETELTNLTAAVRRAADLGLHEVSAQIPIAMLGFVQRTAAGEDWLAAVETGVGSARHLTDDSILGTLLNILGHLYDTRKRRGEALACYSEALAIRRRTGDRVGEARILNSIGIGWAGQGQFEEALAYMRQSLDILSSLDDQREYVGLSLNNLGHVLLSLKRHDEALEALAKALEIHDEIADHFWRGSTYNTIGDTYLDLGRFEEAARHFRMGREVHQQTAPKSTAHVNSLYGLGKALDALGLVADAREAWQSVLPILEHLGDPRATDVRRLLGHAPAEYTAAPSEVAAGISPAS
jgi:DNA-binding SARP family transcriptional activator/tetratricopeptide (TPR) repeat protein